VSTATDTYNFERELRKFCSSRVISAEMLHDAITVVNDHAAIFSALALAMIAGAMFERLRAEQARRRWRSRNQSRWNSGRGAAGFVAALKHAPVPAPTRVTDAADQLRIVMAADFASQPLLNRSEARVFHELDLMVLAVNPSWQVMAQVSLGEVLSTKDKQAYGCINSKRVDLLLVDDYCRPRHVIEYQGAGHHQGSAAARDAVKKEALRRAGIGYHEVIAGLTTPSELRRLVDRLVDEQPRPAVEAEAVGRITLAGSAPDSVHDAQAVRSG
jgi:hypothetical protein